MTWAPGFKDITTPFCRRKGCTNKAVLPSAYCDEHKDDALTYIDDRCRLCEHGSEFHVFQGHDGKCLKCPPEARCPKFQPRI